MHWLSFAGTRLSTDFESAELLAYRVSSPPRVTPGLGASPAFDPAEWSTTGLLAGRERTVGVAVDASGRLIVGIEGLGTLVVSRADGSLAIRFSEPGPGANSHELLEAFMGPGVLSALALEGRFALHASAIEASGAAVAIVGPSGAGKSTIAQHLGTGPGSPWRRIADDVLPASRSGPAKFEAWPDYPQLKLDPALWAAPGTGPVELAAVILLSPPTKGQTDVMLKEYTDLDAIRRLSDQTVGVGLFPAEVRKEHLDFLGELVASVRVLELSYPWNEPVSTAEVGRRLAALTD